MAPSEGSQVPSDRIIPKCRQYTPPVSPISPAESLESLPPATPSDHYHGLANDTPILLPLRGSSWGIQTRLLESGYPSPPSTTSIPKHPVPLPGLQSQQSEATNLNDPLNELYYDFPVQTSFYLGGILDSPLVPRRAVIKPGAALMPSAPHGRPCIDNGHVFSTPELSPCSPLLSLNDASYQSPPPVAIFLKEDLDLLSPLSPEWESNVLAGYDSKPHPPMITTLPSSGQLSTLDELEDDREDRFSMGLSTFADEPSLPSSRPILPLLDIPSAGFTSYAPSPSSPLWLAEEYPLPSASVDDHSEDTDSIVSPPSSGPPDTPSPSSPLLPSLELSDEEGNPGVDQQYGKDHTYFPHPSSPSIRTLQFLKEDEYDQNYDYNNSNNHLSPSSPSLRTFTDLPDSYSYHHEANAVVHPENDVDPESSANNTFTPEGLLLLLNDEDPSDTIVPPSPRSPSPEYDYTLDPTINIADFAGHEEVQKLAGLQKKAQTAERVAKEREQAAIAAALSFTAASGRGQHVASDGTEFAVHAEEGLASNVWQLQRAAAEARSVAKKERERAREVGALLRLKMKERAVAGLKTGGEVVESTSPPAPPAAIPNDDTDNTNDSSALSLTPSHPQLEVTSSFKPPKRPRMATIAQLVAKMFLHRHEAPSPPSPPNPSISPSPSTSTTTRSSKYRALWLKGLAVASVGAGSQHQPFLPYQQRYKFLRSSPLARTSVVAPDYSERDGDADVNLSNTIENGNDGSRSGMVGDLFEDDEDEGGFEALRTPITWGLDLQDMGSGGGEEGVGRDDLLPAL